MAATAKSSSGKMIGATVLLLAAIAFVYAQYARSRPQPVRPAPPTPTAGQGPAAAQGPGAEAVRSLLGQITPEERIQFRQQVYQQLELTTEQRARLDEIDKKYDPQMRQGREVALERMRESAAVLTPEQRTKAADYMREQLKQRMAERAKVLPPEEQKKFMEKLDQRFEQRRQQFEQNLRSGSQGAQPTPAPAAPPVPPAQTR